METPPVGESRCCYRYFQYQYVRGRDLPADVRNLLLVIASLIAAVTFQAGVSPPGGVWQDEGKGKVAGRAIYATNKNAYYVFVISNTVAFSISILVIISLTRGFPFHFELVMAAISLLITYGSAIFAITPDEPIKIRYVLIAAALPFVLRGLMKVFHNHKLRRRMLEHNEGHDNGSV